MDNLPCLECILLPICRNKKEIVCSLLLRYIQNYEYEVGFNGWREILCFISKTLGGSWCLLSTSGNISYIYQDTDNLVIVQKMMEN